MERIDWVSDIRISDGIIYFGSDLLFFRMELFTSDVIY